MRQVEQSLVGVYITDRDRMLYCNEAFARIFGYAVAEIVGKRGVLPPVLAVWSPNLLMGALSLLLLSRGASERPIRLPGVDALFRLKVFQRD